VLVGQLAFGGMHVGTVTFLAIAVLMGCAGQPHSRELERPAPGHAKLYVLRPAFSDVSRSDSPTLYINDAKAARLEFQSYAEFSLKPGTYRLSLDRRAQQGAAFRAGGRKGCAAGPCNAQLRNADGRELRSLAAVVQRRWSGAPLDA
jgi:hypothetical protein